MAETEGKLLTCELDGLKVENDRLRELASTMLRCIKAHEQKRLVCWECPAHKQFDELRWGCCITFDANELGVTDV